MKKLFLVTLVMIFLTGCATSRVTTDIGVAIGDSFQKAAAKGTISAAESITAWPYVSGQIKGLMADNYKIEMVPMAQGIIKDLDKLALKESLTKEQQGFVIGSFVRLESLAIQYSWDRYGVSILNLVKTAMGG